MAHRDFVAHPLVLRRLDVLRVRDVTPRMRRVTLGGVELAAFEREGLRFGAFHAPGFDDHVKAIFAAPEELADALPVQLEDGIEWKAAPARIARDYTPRRVDLDAGEVDLDFVLHGDGPASNWVRGARVGDALWVVGPKSSLVIPDGLEWIALVGDETALPAIGRFFDERPVDVPARVVITISDPSARQEITVRDGDSVIWIVAEPTDREALERAVRSAIPEAGEGYVWAAGESRTLLPLRRFLARERGVPKGRVNITGYWHADHEERDPVYPEVPSPVAWFTVRAAFACGLLDDVVDHPDSTPEEVCSRLGISSAALAALLPTLTHHGMLVALDGGLRVGPAAEEMLANEHAREGFDGHEGDVLHALGELSGALAGDTTAWRRARGRTLSDEMRQAPEIFAEACEEAGVLRFFATSLFRDRLWGEARSALFLGPGSVELIGIARECGVDARALLGGTDVERRVLADAAQRAELEVPLDDGLSVDVAVLALSLHVRDDAGARAVFEELRERARTVVVVDRARPDSLDPRAHEAWVTALAVNGAGMRGVDEIARLASASGWRAVRSQRLGWGVDAVVLQADV